MRILPFNLCIAFLSVFLVHIATPAFSSPTPTPTAIIIPTPTVTPTPTPTPEVTGDYWIYLETLEATNITSNSATLNGSVGETNSYSPTVWFTYGLDPNLDRRDSDSISETSQGGIISIDIDGLRPNTTYYYFTGSVDQPETPPGYADLEVWLEDGDRRYFTTQSIPIPTTTPTPISKISIYGYILDKDNNPIKSAKIILKGIKSKYKGESVSDADGYFEFTNIKKGKYFIYVSKMGYKKYKKKVELREGKTKEVEVLLKDK